MESEIYYCVHYSQSLVTTLSYTLSSYTFKLKFNIIISSTPRSSKLVSSCKSLPIETLCTSAGEPMALLSACRCGKVSLTRGIHFCPLFPLSDQRLYIVNICIYSHIWPRRECIWITVAINIFTQTESGAKCLLDIYYWSAGQAVTGRIHDTGQKDLHSYFQTGSSSSPSYFHIFFLIAFLEKDFIWNIIIVLYFNCIMH